MELENIRIIVAFGVPNRYSVVKLPTFFGSKTLQTIQAGGSKAVFNYLHIHLIDDNESNHILYEVVLGVHSSADF